MFLKDLKETDFDLVCSESNLEIADTLFLKLLNEVVDDNLPEKIVRLKATDKRFFTSELKQIDRQSKREFTKRGKTDKFFNLRQKLKLLYDKTGGFLNLFLYLVLFLPG